MKTYEISFDSTRIFVVSNTEPTITVLDDDVAEAVADNDLIATPLRDLAPNVKIADIEL